jgi:hypothetical protein
VEAKHVWAFRRRQARETLALLAEQHHPPTRDDAVRVHLLHAQHERECGRIERAEAAEQRAKRASKRTQL